MLLDLETNLYQAAIQYANLAGDLIKKHIGNTGVITQKRNPSDLVTEVDKMCEELIRRKIEEDFPHHWILSEEDCGQANAYEILRNAGAGYGWIIDPIDGTTNFIHDIPYYAVSIAFVKNKVPVAGVVFNPLTSEQYTARKSFGAYLNEKRIQTGREKLLTEAVVATGFQSNDFKTGSRVVQQIDKLAGKSRNIRLLGASSLDLCRVASGKLTGFWHEGLKPWDTAAGILILTEAGGKVTDKEGNPFQLDHESLVASNGHIHHELMQAIRLS
ncbi:inositol monophosphatase [Bacillaceae bacterium Marseille-Q3522]|nr:inositol monophosphatase [Bacillaceae bacterium Marseille-Q3522]